MFVINIINIFHTETSIVKLYDIEMFGFNQPFMFYRAFRYVFWKNRKKGRKRILVLSANNLLSYIYRKQN